jgi:tetratricopeptide (TPR) repeat protein
MKRRTGIPKPGPGQKPSVPDGTTSPAVPTPALTHRRRWLFRVMAAVIVPLLALGGLEAGLRLAGYGYDTGFFKKIRVGQKTYLVSNENFDLRFFPPQLARYPVPIMMEAKKPAGTCRIFIFGESAALGDPAPAYGASRYLDVLLRERFPGTKFEVINLGMAAIDSHVIVPIARECAHDQGDFWIIYMGNNEMVGPFGAVTVFGIQAPPLWFVRLNLAIQQTRVGQLMMALARKLQGKTADASWRGMEMFLGNRIRPGDPRKETVYRNFQHNLDDIVHAGLGSGAKIILNTVAVNLKDCPPFASLSATNLSPTDRAACDGLMADGLRAERQNHFEQAATCFAQAARLDPQRPDLQFHWGECLLRQTNFAAAREHFRLARDDDALPFRADSRINDLIRQTGRHLAGPDLVLFDAVAALETNNPAGICGQETFYEHVHFNFDGDYRLGLAWARQIEPLLPGAVKDQAAGDWASQEICERRLGLTDWNRRLVLEGLIRRLNEPPLSSQSDNARRLETMQAEERELSRRTNAPAVAEARDIYQDAIRRAPDDSYLYGNYARFLMMTGDYATATTQWREVIRLLPDNSLGYFETGGLLGLQGQLAEAQTDFDRAVALRPNFAECWFQLGNLHAAEQNFGLALEEYTHAWRLDPQNAMYCVFVGKALLQLNRRDEAVQHYRQALQLDPGFWQVHFLLGNLWANENKMPEAEHEYEEIIQLQPTNALAHLDLGVTLGRQGRYDAAVRQFEETLRLDPGNRMAQTDLEQTRQALNGGNP